MELKEFIKTALSDIAYAIKESQEELAGIAVINPPHSESGITTKTSFYDKHIVNFDIAVSASSEEDKGAGVSVFSAISGKVTSNTTNREASRITFSIPVYLSRGLLQGYDRLQLKNDNSPFPSYAAPKAKVEQNA